MRTRLDEIVEEENVAPAFCDEAKRIAELAFRHGVERTLAQWDEIDDCLERVQPAPAEEKAKGDWTPHYWCHVPGCHSEDRRKGQRRNRSAMKIENGRLFEVVDLEEKWNRGKSVWSHEQRSGQERRINTNPFGGVPSPDTAQDRRKP